MKLFRIIIRCIVLCVLTGCAFNIIGSNRYKPRYDGVDERAAPLVNEWILLAKERGIVFNKTVTIGFGRIGMGNAVGLTTYGWGGFREIDVDLDYWTLSSPIRKTILLWHECVHAYCGRDHDYGAGKSYSEDENQKEGMFEDGCPLTIMYPYVIEENCFHKHYSEYVNEMFQRCAAF